MTIVRESNSLYTFETRPFRMLALLQRHGKGRGQQLTFSFLNRINDHSNTALPKFEFGDFFVILLLISKFSIYAFKRYKPSDLGLNCLKIDIDSLQRAIMFRWLNHNYQIGDIYRSGSTVSTHYLK